MVWAAFVKWEKYVIEDISPFYHSAIHMHGFCLEIPLGNRGSMVEEAGYLSDTLGEFTECIGVQVGQRKSWGICLAWFQYNMVNYTMELHTVLQWWIMVKLGTHKRHRQAMGCLLWIFGENQVSHVLTRLPLVPHICVSELGEHWFR